MRAISIPIPPGVYAVILYGGRFHSTSLPRIRHHFIRGPFPSRFLTVYTPSFYARAISIPIPRVYAVILYGGHFSSSFSTAYMFYFY